MTRRQVIYREARIAGVQVTLGRTSANAVEIVSGLDAGDVVILSDMSRFDAVDRVRVK